MIQIYACLNKDDETAFKKVTDLLSKNKMWNNSNLYITNTLQSWIGLVKDNYPVDVLICDVTQKGAIDIVKKARKLHSEAMIIPIADITVPPSEYVCPEIRPYTLFWKPLNAPMLKNSVMDILSYIFSKEESEQENVFKLATKRETRYIPYSNIIYFEARDKKIFVRLKYREICFYSTLGNLEKELPEEFIRCHKSFIVNSTYIRELDWADNMIYMNDKIRVPLSRSYRNLFREDEYAASSL